jgi:hypothetical protein
MELFEHDRCALACLISFFFVSPLQYNTFDRTVQEHVDIDSTVFTHSSAYM